MHARARQKESEYEQSIAAYKETPTFRFLIKWKNKRQVRQRKKALQEANRSLRLHYYVRLSTTRSKYSLHDRIVLLPGIYIGCIGCVISNRCIWLTTTKSQRPQWWGRQTHPILGWRCGKLGLRWFRFCTSLTSRMQVVIRYIYLSI